MDGLGGHYTKRNKSEKDKYCMISHVESKKYNKLVTITKKQTHRFRANEWPPVGRRKWRGSFGGVD